MEPESTLELKEIPLAGRRYMVLLILIAIHESYYIRLYFDSGVPSSEISGCEKRGITEKCILPQFERSYGLTEMHEIR